MPGGKCIFNLTWLSQGEYKAWLQKTANKNTAKCIACNSVLDVSVMGESALKAHMKGKRHLALVKKLCSPNNNLNRFLQKIDQKEHHQKIEESAIKNQSEESTPMLPTFVSKNDTLKSEIIWALKCVFSNYSYNSCTDITKLFTYMFPDSMIAKSFTCGEKKCSYLCCFGLAPHFKKLLFVQLKNAAHYVIMFDETLNSHTQSKQMDILVRFWHPDLNEVSTRYLTSAFMGHSTSDDLMKNFMVAVEDLQLSKVLQISMDGPAVNWKFYKELQKEIKNDYNNLVLNIGSCGLHVLHNAFKAGVSASDWNIDSVLSSLHYLFHNSPARSEDYMNLSKTKKLPMSFCNHRWLENIPVGSRAVEIWNDVETYVSNVEKGKVTKPSCKSFQTVQAAVKDKLFLVKLNFFLSFAKIVQPFLILYQSDKPLLPFLADDLTKLIINCLSTFSALKEEKLKSISNAEKLASFVFGNDVKNDFSKCSLGFIADKMIKKLIFSNQTSEREILQIKKEALGFVFAFVKKVLEKSPINYTVVRKLSCLDPREMAKKKESVITRMKSILHILAESGYINEGECDTVMAEFKNFIGHVSTTEFSNFDPNCNRLDTFLFNHMNKTDFSKIWNVVKILLVLSHGQASVERGFSINKTLEVENMQEKSYVSLRIIKDHINFC